MGKGGEQGVQVRGAHKGCEHGEGGILTRKRKEEEVYISKVGCVLVGGSKKKERGGLHTKECRGGS